MKSPLHMLRRTSLIALALLCAPLALADTSAQLEQEQALSQITAPMNQSVVRRLMKAIPQVSRNAAGAATGLEVDGGALAGSGTVTNLGGALTANSVVLGAGTTDTKVVAGILSDGVSKFTLGVAGTSVGAIDFKNATSGTLTLVPVTGALGTVTLKLPAATDTLVGLATTDTLLNKTLTSPAITGGTADAFAIGWREIPQNSKSAAYTTVLGDSGKHLYHPSADTTARIWTIDSNANVAYPIGTVLTIVNDSSAGALTISITADTLMWADTGGTGSRTCAAVCLASVMKVTATKWIISGPGLT